MSSHGKRPLPWSEEVARQAAAKRKRGILHAPEQRADLRKLGTLGDVPNVPDRAALRLARAMHAAESTDVATSWSAQERAERYYNEHGLGRTLDEAARLEALRLPGASS